MSQDRDNAMDAPSIDLSVHAVPRGETQSAPEALAVATDGILASSVPELAMVGDAVVTIGILDVDAAELQLEAGHDSAVGWSQFVMDVEALAKAAVASPEADTDAALGLKTVKESDLDNDDESGGGSCVRPRNPRPSSPSGGQRQGVEHCRRDMRRLVLSALLSWFKMQVGQTPRFLWEVDGTPQDLTYPDRRALILWGQEGELTCIRRLSPPPKQRQLTAGARSFLVADNANRDMQIAAANHGLAGFLPPGTLPGVFVSCTAWEGMQARGDYVHLNLHGASEGEIREVGRTHLVIWCVDSSGHAGPATSGNSRMTESNRSILQRGRTTEEFPSNSPAPTPGRAYAEPNNIFSGLEF